MSMIKLVFFGTSDFAVPSLKALAKDPRFKILSVVTQPDRAVGRHATVTPPAVKTAALELKLPVLQYAKVKDTEAIETIKALNADLAIVISFGQLIPQALLDVFPLGAVNVHGSLLPKYRGASPIQAAIREGDSQTGVTIMLLDKLMDHGPILHLATEPIYPTDTASSLHDRLAELGAATLSETLIGYQNGTIKPVVQDHTQATHVSLLSREAGELKPTEKTAGALEHLVRAYTPWPGTFLQLDQQKLKIKQVAIGAQTTHQPGTKTIGKDGQPILICRDGMELILTLVQPEGKREMSGRDFLRGHVWH